MSGPLVSAVIPARDAERYLGEAIASVLAQTHREVEVVVVDDGSRDGTAEVARSFGPPVRCHSQPPSGTGAARNHGVELAGGDYVAFLDADDLWHPRKIELQLAAFDERPRPDIVFGLLDQFVSPDLDEATAQRLVCPEGLQPGYLPSAMVAPAAVFQRVGLFATKLVVGEFVDWMARARELGLRERMVPERVLSRRIHGANQTLRHRDSMSDLPHILKAALERRREGAGR